MHRISFSFATLAILVGACGFERPMFECEKTAVAEASAPDGSYTAKLMNVACGATTRDTIWLLIGPRQDPARLERVAVLEGGVAALAWNGNAELIISVEELRVIRSQDRWEKVDLRYHAVPLKAPAEPAHAGRSEVGDQ